jgi:hypothetical protein
LDFIDTVLKKLLICGSHSATEAGNGKAHGFLCQYKYMDNIKWDDEVPETCGSGKNIRIPPQTPVKGVELW